MTQAKNVRVNATMVSGVTDDAELTEGRIARDVKGDSLIHSIEVAEKAAASTVHYPKSVRKSISC